MGDFVIVTLEGNDPAGAFVNERTALQELGGELGDLLNHAVSVHGVATGDDARDLLRRIDEIHVAALAGSGARPKGGHNP